MLRSLLIMFAVLMTIVAACGYDSNDGGYYGQQPGGDGGDDGGGGDGTDDGGGDGGNPAPTGDALVEKECGRCHKPGGRKPNPQIRTVSEYRRAGSSRLVRSGDMPPDKALDARSKAALLAL